MEKLISKAIAVFMCILIVFTSSVTIFAEESVCYVNDIDEGILEDIECEPDIAEDCESVSFEAISDPQYTYEDAENEMAKSSRPARIIGNTGESTDRIIHLDSLTDAAVKGEINNGNLKRLFPRSSIYNYAKSEFPLSSQDSYVIIMQGACSDGEYLFYSFTVYKNNNKEEGNLIGTIIVTCHLTIVGIMTDCYHSSKDNSKLINIGHANSLTYNSLKKEIVVACAGNNSQVAYTMNVGYFRNETSTLTMDKHYVSCEFSSITYNSTLNRYAVNVSGQHNYICILDSDFNLIEKYRPTQLDSKAENNISDIGHQGLCCDDTYIYSLYYIGKKTELPSVKVQNVLAIFNWKGKLIKEINLCFDRKLRNGYADSFEFENIILKGDKVLLGLNCSYSQNNETRKRHFYYYDLSSQFFHIQYCPDTNVQSHVNDTNKIMSNVLYNQSTNIKKNTFTKTGYEFTGWTLYIPNEDIWSYKNSEGTYKWCKEGTQPAGYSKSLYKDKATVSQTVKAGKTVMFCANWKATDKFYVTFNANGGSGSMPSQTVTYGTLKEMPANTFTKSGRTFKGWTIYNSEKSTWLYENSDGSKTGWYKEGTAPTGYTKKAYVNKTKIAKTVPAGQHAIFYAQWNEYIIIYDANGVRVKVDGILEPTQAVYGNSNTVRKYDKGQIREGKTLKGYRQHRLELDKWRFQNKTDSSDTPWFNKSTVNTDKYKYYLYTGTTVKQTVQIGEHVVFQAQWA